MFDNLWAWIRKCGDSRKSLFFSCLQKSFDQLSESGRISVCGEYHEALKSLDNQTIWSLGSLIFGQPLGDDSFKDFRRWLIFQGDIVFNSSLNTPDSLHNEFLLRAGDERIFVEGIDWLDDLVALIYPVKKVPTSTWETPNVDMMQMLLPLTFDALGTAFTTGITQSAETTEMFVEGLGAFRLGDRVRHKGIFGVGVIREIPLAETGLATIEFEGAVRTMRISPSFFERADA